jgi:hypothetical protein
MATPRGKRTTELTVREDGTLDVAEVMGMIRRGEKLHLAENDNEQTAIEILERTMGATTADELFSDGGTSKAAEYINIPFQLRSVSFRNSDFDEGCGIYAVLSGVTAHGEMVTVAAGSTNVVVRAIKALELNALPRWVKLTEDTTKGGFKVYNLSSATAPTVTVDDDGNTF